jgi:hypothetical protein
MSPAVLMKHSRRHDHGCRRTPNVHRHRCDHLLGPVKDISPKRDCTLPREQNGVYD